MKLAIAIIPVFLVVQPVEDGAAAFRQRYRETLMQGQPRHGANAYPLIEQTAAKIKDLSKGVIERYFPGDKSERLHLQSFAR